MQTVSIRKFIRTSCKSNDIVYARVIFIFRLRLKIEHKKN